jgi:hypothetical protein
MMCSGRILNKLIVHIASLLTTTSTITFLLIGSEAILPGRGFANAQTHPDNISDRDTNSDTEVQANDEPAWQAPELNWQPVEGTWQPTPPKREDFGKIKVVWLQGTPYEMGYQHGELLHDEIATMGREVINTLNFFGRALGLERLSRRRSFPGVFDECRGLTDATADIGMTIEACMVLALGDVYQAYFGSELPDVLFYDGCAHFVASGEATVDGRFYQGWTLDNNGGPVAYWAEHPTILVRQPNNGIPHVFITVPGMIWPNGGFNAEGVIVSNNTSHPAVFDDLDLFGWSTIQIMSQVTQFARNYDEAADIIATHSRMRSNLVIVSDAKSERAGVFELLGVEMGVRELDDNGLLYMTNHFADPDFVNRDRPNQSSFNRFLSFQQMLEPDGVRSRFGDINPEVAVEILRDRTNPNTFEVSPWDVKDDDASIGGNGSHRQVVFDPTGLRFWMTNSEVEQPIPESPFVCFSMRNLLGLSNAEPCLEPAIE